jgi:hypothetical protein
LRHGKEDKESLVQAATEQWGWEQRLVNGHLSMFDSETYMRNQAYSELSMGMSFDLLTRAEYGNLVAEFQTGNKNRSNLLF